MTAPDPLVPADPDQPVISSQDELATALAQHYLDNACTGRNADNDELVARIIAWKRSRRN